MTPRISLFRETTRGVPPDRAMRSTTVVSSAGTLPPRARTCVTMASAAPLRMTRPSKSTPLIRVCALNGTNLAPCGASGPVPTGRPRRPYLSFARTTMLRPSGVSSASEASCEISASWRLSVLVTGMNSTACRLPSVIVPVLSSSRTSTSPAASTARPESAITLRLIMRSIPAMPIALSRPPIVVGMRQTRSATSTVIVTGVPRPATPTLNTEYGSSVAQTIKNRIVNPASRMLRAISLGVFWRRAPSISRIMRSMNPSPGSAVTRTINQSDRTRVLPVTALRSPPDSRITGALSPVTALSSTDAIPTTTSPSAGIISPVSTSTTSPFRSPVDETISALAPRSGRCRRLAGVSRRARRSASACAFPRPSAKASAKFAKTTVNHNHAETLPMKGAGASPRPPNAWTNRTAVRVAPISTTNMTGFRTCWRGSSRRNASRTAIRQIMAVWTGCSVPCCICALISLSSLEDRARLQQEVLDDRTERQRWQKAQGTDNDGHRHQPQDKLSGVRRQGARAYRDLLLRPHRAGDRQRRDDDPETGNEHHDAADEIVKWRVRVQFGKRAAVVLPHRGERVEHLAEHVRPRVRDPRPFRGGGDTERREHQNHGRHDEHDHCRHLHLEGFDLLAEILGGPSHHQPGNESREDRQDQHPVQPRADAAEDHLAEVHHDKRHHPRDRCERIVHRVDRAVGCGGGGGGPQRRVDDAEAHLLAFHVSTGLQRTRGLIHAGRPEERVPAELEPFGHPEERDEDQHHRREQRPPLPGVADHDAKRVRQRRGDQGDCQHLQKVRKRRRVFERRCRVCVEEPAAVRAKLLDGNLRGRGAHRDQLFAHFDRLGRGLALRVQHGLACGISDRLLV